MNLVEDFTREVRLSDVITENTVLLFDMDGTLVDTDYANFLAYQMAISSVTKLDLHIEYNPHIRLNRNSLNTLVPFLSEIEYHKIIEMKEEIYHNYLHEIQVRKEQINVVFEYTKLNKIILVTNSYSDRAMAILKYFKLIEYFDEIFCQESMNENNEVNKFQNAIDKLGLPPNMIIAFENEKSEILLAIKAGIEIINPKVDVCNAKI